VVFCLFVFISTGILPRYLVSQLESNYHLVQEVNPKIKWVVVLGGGRKQLANMPVNELLTSSSEKRLLEGVRLFRQLPDAKLLLSGGKSEAVSMAELCGWFAIPKHKIIIEQYSLNTEEQAKELKKIVHEQPFYLVTSALHMSRAIALCRKYGLNPIPAPADFNSYWSTHRWVKMLVPNTYNLSYFSMAFHEVMGKIWVFVIRSHLDS
jgi:uncharacterized SAM-binding protein YcdF (DUF218 family)